MTLDPKTTGIILRQAFPREDRRTRLLFVWMVLQQWGLAAWFSGQEDEVLWDNLRLNAKTDIQSIGRLRDSLLREGGPSGFTPITLVIHKDNHAIIRHPEYNGAWMSTVMDWARVRDLSGTQTDAFTREVFLDQTERYKLESSAARDLNLAAFSFKCHDWRTAR